ncbi:MAG TPA: efflux transporter outer membrane subunit [Verrucomicrobiae bacterium]|nr:efflux transporter outer membrane subunit [Verrucomicrobiae bacterium]
MTKVHAKILVLPALTAICLSGCMVGPKYHQPAATVQPPAPAYKEIPGPSPDQGTWKAAQPQDAMLRGKWWEIYNDPELNALEEQLQINNQNIKQAFENYMAARTLITQARSQLYPTITTGPSFANERGSAKVGSVPVTSTGAAGQALNLWTLPGTVSWEPDLWGKIRNTIHEQQYNAQVSAADLEGEKLTEEASLASFFFELRGQDALQKLYDDTIVADQKTVQLSRDRYETGVDDLISLVEAQNALQNAQAAATALGVARAQYEHAIAVLIGSVPANFSMPVKPLSATPPPVPLGVPSQLLERRPDVAASERSMAAANAQIGIAVSAYYPTLTISATGGFEASALQNLFTWPARFWSVGPSLSETVFDAGLRRATVNQYIAVYNSDVAGYRQTVLNAFQQVEDNLAAERIISKEIQQQEEAVASAQKYLELALARYETGVDQYLTVLTAQTTLLSDQQQLASLRIQFMTYNVQLVEALGGGWDLSQLPTPAQVSEKVTKSEIEAPNQPAAQAPQSNTTNP